MPDDELSVETQLRITKPPSDVYEAIVNPAQMSGYFTSSGSARLDAEEPVTWEWTDVGGRVTVTPQEIEPDQRVAFLWSASGDEARVVIDLVADGADATVVKVSETGWPRDAEGTARCLQQTQGWMHMLCCMKAYLEHGIDLRRGGVVKGET